ncbi:MAG: hypothetical protein P4M04_16320 [Acidobacteriota bacterium]|nr:hypothetical protein [Acidobacteriota bacterium]
MMTRQLRKHRSAHKRANGTGRSSELRSGNRSSTVIEEHAPQTANEIARPAYLNAFEGVRRFTGVCQRDKALHEEGYVID